MDNKFNANNFINMPVPGEKLENVLRIYDKNRNHVFSIDPYITDFKQKDRYIYIIVQNKLIYRNTLDFSSKKEADKARSKLFKIKELYLENIKGEYYTRDQIDDRLEKNKIEALNDSLSAVTDLVNEDFIKEEIDKKLSGSNSFTGESLVNLGGIKSGDVFSGATVQELWDALIRPYQHPSINLDSNLPNIVEAGYFLNSNYSFSWNTSNEQNVSGLTTLIGPNKIFTDLPLSGSTGYTISIQNNDNTSENWQIEGVDTKGNNFSDSETVYWKFKIFYGTNPSTSITDNEILSLNSEFSNNRYKTWYQDGNSEYIYYCFPSSFGDISSGAPFEVNNLPNTAWTKEIRELQLSTGINIEYIIYRTDKLQNGTGIKIEKL